MKEKLQRRIASVKKATEELKVERDMLKSELEGSLEYQEIVEQIKQLNLKKKELLSKGILEELNNKIQDSNQEVRELKEILSSELLNYFKDTDKTDIEDNEGKICQIILNAKLKKSNQRNLF